MFVIKVIKNRFFITIAVIFLIGTMWNIYISGNNDGFITGYVVDENGTEVSQATVYLNRVGGLGLFTDSIISKTDKKGKFIFIDQELLEFDMHVEKEGYVKTEKKRFHLYFKSQNFLLPEPIVIQKENNRS